MSSAPGWIACERVELATCASTNDEAARLAAAGAPAGTIVVAREQTAGRGRRGRRWHSPPGNDLYMSCVVRPQLAAKYAAGLSLAAGIAVCDAVNFFAVGASVKWPNDVVASRGKLAGVLTEMSTRAQSIEHIVVGIGIDANTVEFPPDLGGIATSMRLERGAPVDLGALEARVCRELESWLDRFFAGGVPGIRAEWSARARLGGRVRVTQAGAVIEGRAVGIDDSGSLEIVDDGGCVHRITAGDVVETRTADQ